MHRFVLSSQRGDGQGWLYFPFASLTKWRIARTRTPLTRLRDAYHSRIRLCFVNCIVLNAASAFRFLRCILKEHILRRLLTMALAMLLVPGTSGQAPDAWKLPDFTAMEHLQFRGRSTAPSKIYRSGTKFRIEFAPSLASVYVPEKDRAYNLFNIDTAKPTCVEMKTNQVTMLPSPMQLISGIKVERTGAGTEEFEGHRCKVETVVATAADGKTTSLKVWEAEDLKGVPVKIAVKARLGQGLVAVYRDIKLENVSDELFNPPYQCTPLERVGQVASPEEQLKPPKPAKKQPIRKPPG